MQISTRWMIGALALGVACGGAQVEPPGEDCESQGSNATTQTPVTTSGPTEAGSVTEVGTTGSEGSSGTTGSTTDPGGSSEGTASDTGQENCVGADGCFDCAPQKPLEFLNACTDAACSGFENTQKRLPLLNDDGTRPPLP